jgi:hypothetical protein
MVKVANDKAGGEKMYYDVPGWLRIMMIIMMCDAWWHLGIISVLLYVNRSVSSKQRNFKMNKNVGTKGIGSVVDSKSGI